MKVNYKFQIQVKLNLLTYYLDRSLDIEISNLERLGQCSDFDSYLGEVKDLYYAYFGYGDDLRVCQLDNTDINFIAFLQDVRNANFENIKFNGDFVPVVGRHGNGFEFVLYANEG